MNQYPQDSSGGPALQTSAHLDPTRPTARGTASGESARPFIGPTLVFGFGTAVAMWCMWFITHLPAVDFSPSVAGPLILGVVVAGMFWCGRAMGGFGTKHAALVGLCAGLLSMALTLFLIASKLVEQPEQAALAGSSPTAPASGAAGLRPDAWLAVLGFLALGATVGGIGGFVGGLSNPLGRRRDDWLWRFSLVAAAAFLPLLLVGGLVTSTRSGMAVPDWPNSYGANMFLYPISLMSHPRIFLEHSHRLLGALVGLTTLASMLYTLLARGPERAPAAARTLSVIVFVLVVAQGILGGLRVTENSPVLAMLHGISAQIVFALACWLAAMLLPSLRAVTPNEKPEKLARISATGTVHATVLQLSFGAAYRHLHQLHALWSHVGFAFVVLILGIIAGAASQKKSQGPDPESPAAKLYRRAGLALVIVVSIQFTLGWAALGIMGIPSKKPEIPTADALASAEEVPHAQALVRTIHQANGAVLLGLGTVVSTAAQRLNRRRR